MKLPARLILAPLALTLVVGAAGSLGGCDERPQPQADDLQPAPPQEQPAPQTPPPTMPHQETDPERDTGF